MKKLSLVTLAILSLTNSAWAQRVNNPTPNAGVYGAYNASPPTCVSGVGCWFQTDINGNLKVAVSGGSGTAVTQGTIPWIVSNAGTFATQTTLAAETTKVIGTVNQGTSPWVVSGSITASGTVAATQSGTWTVQPGNTANTTAWLTNTPAADPCQSNTATYTPISITSATTTRIIAPASAKRTYVCYMFLLSAIANNIGIVEGTGGTCGASTAGIVGGTTAANGINLTANGGAVFQAGGNTALATAGTNVDLCLITSAAGPTAGTVKWVQAP